MNINLNATLAISLVLGLGISILSWATDGWRFWTTESLRRHALVESARSLPRVSMETNKGQSSFLSDYEQPVLIVDFIYTSCPTRCVAMGSSFYQIQQSVEKLGHDNNVQLLSISFDHKSDDPRALSAYLKRHTNNVSNWDAIRISEESDLSRILDDFGVVVLPDPIFGYIHNSAIYVFHNGKVVEIFDYDQPNSVISKIRTLFESNA